MVPRSRRSRLLVAAERQTRVVEVVGVDHTVPAFRAFAVRRAFLILDQTAAARLL
jgi:hypothetical protein